MMIRWTSIRVGLAAAIAAASLGCSADPAGADPAASVSTDAGAAPRGDGAPLDGAVGDADASAVAVRADENLSDEERYPLHGVALFHHVNVYSEPSSRSERLGVLRRGARVRVGPALEGRGCREGRWHPVRPFGYICSGRTMRLDEEPPPIAFVPEPPRLDSPTPYDYGRNRREGVPLYRRIPTPAQLTAEREYQAQLAAERAAAAAAVAAGPGDGGVSSEAGPPPAAAEEPEEEEEDEDEDDEDDEDEGNTGPIVQRLNSGFYVTVEAILSEHGRRWVRTSELNYVEANAIYRRQVPEIEGTELGDELTLPIVIPYRDSRTRTIGANGRPRRGREIEAFTPLPMLGETRLNNETYYTIGDNEVIAADRVRRIDPTDPPPEVGPNERWIDVNLDRQFMVAYEGARPVYATLVSTGKREFETPEGAFRIESKFISTNMSDAPDGDEPYLIEDVPWTMYFHLAVALHGAFWHSRLGRERSHGCVNLAPADARWLFFWVGPELPEGWHGVSATEDNPGTRVYVHD